MNGLGDSREREQVSREGPVAERGVHLGSHQNPRTTPVSESAAGFCPFSTPGFFPKADGSRKRAARCPVNGGFYHSPMHRGAACARPHPGLQDRESSASGDCDPETREADLMRNHSCDVLSRGRSWPLS